MKNYNIKQYFKINSKLGLINKLFVNLKKNSYKSKFKYKISKNNFYIKNIFKYNKLYSTMKESKDNKKNLLSYKELICSFLILKGKSKLFQQISKKSFEYLSKKYPKLNIYYIIKNFFSFYSLPVTYMIKNSRGNKRRKNNYNVQWLNTQKERQAIFNFFKEFLKKQLRRNLFKNFQPIFLSLSSNKTELLKIQVENIKKNVTLWKSSSKDFRNYSKELKIVSRNLNSLNTFPENIKQKLNFKISTKQILVNHFNKYFNFILNNNNKTIIYNRKTYYNYISKHYFKMKKQYLINSKYYILKNNQRYNIIIKNEKLKKKVISAKDKMNLFISLYDKILKKSKKNIFFKNYLTKKFFWKKNKLAFFINNFFFKVDLITKNIKLNTNFLLTQNSTLFNYNKHFFFDKSKNISYLNLMDIKEKNYWRNFLNQRISDNNLNISKNTNGRFNIIQKSIPNYIKYLLKNNLLYWKKNFSNTFLYKNRFMKQNWNKTFFLIKKKKTKTFFFNKIPFYKTILSPSQFSKTFINKKKNIIRLSMFSYIKLYQGLKIDFKAWDKKDFTYLNKNLEKKLYSFFKKNDVLIISTPLKIQKTRRTVLTSPHANKNAQQHFEKTVYTKSFKIFFISNQYNSNYYYYFNFMKTLLENDFKNYGLSISLISSQI
jgi:ribosomal protein S10